MSESKPITVSINTLEQCHSTISKRNVSDFLNLGSAFGGVPANFVWNLIAWIVLIIFFYLTRKIFFAHILRTKWTLLKKKLGWRKADTNKNKDDVFRVKVRDETLEDDIEEVESLLFFDSNSMTDHTLKHRMEQLEKRHHQAENLNSFWEWFKFSLQWVTFSDEDIHELAGIDGVQYLKFERHLIIITAILSVTSLIVILPINISAIQWYDGQQTLMELTLQHFSLTNRQPRDPLLYFHTFFTFLLFPVSIIVMRNFSRGKIL